MMNVVFLSYRTMENVPPFTVGQQGMGSSSGGQEQDDPESMTDEQLAWKLMQEEEQALQQRMMAMAGLGALDVCLLRMRGTWW